MSESNVIKKQWHIRKYQEGDEDQILELRGATLGVSRNIPWWNWIYKNGPDGPALFYLAVDNQMIIGINPGLPLRMKIGNQVYKSVLGFDVMTHPDYQRQGVLSALGPIHTENLLKNGVSISYGSSTPQRYPVYQKMKLSYDIFGICQPPLLVKVINWGEVLKTRYGIPSFAGNLFGYVWERMTNPISSIQNGNIEIEQISSFNESIDTFWLKASEIKQIMIVRDMKYLNWRYVKKPGKDYAIFVAKRQKEIIGFIVVRSETDIMTRGFIVDLLTLPDEGIVATGLITRAIEYLQKKGAANVLCLMLQDTPYYGILRKMGFTQRDSGIQLNIRIYDRSLSTEFVTNPGNWYFVWGDTDTR